MQTAQGIAKLLDLRLGNVFFVLRAGQLFGNIFQITKNTFKCLPNAFHFGFRLLDQ